ncbi:hypothetical protein [Ectobacillus panaciterrae]|uniref:hypothetical protein n=1 Tax=Ectobacillus panaciterrae TaxID=363872 RepID=UPI000408D474|nr:hypothetical protein [Ectobacillus panaciterrae]
MKGLKTITTGLLVAGLLVGCSEASTVEVKDKTAEQKTVKKNIKESDVGTRFNPVQKGHSKTFDDRIIDEESSKSYKAKIEVSVKQVLRGQQAWDIIHKESELNKVPQDGMEYALVKLEVKVVDADIIGFSYRTADILNVEFVSLDGKVYREDTKHHPIIPTPLNNDIFKGAEAQGYVVQYVKQGDDFKIVYKTNGMKKVYFNSK